MTSRRSFLILVGVTLVAVLAAVISQQGTDQVPTDYGLHAPDLGDRTGEVRIVEIHTATDNLALIRTDEGWRAANRGGYPANAERVRELVLGMSQLRRLERKTRDPARHDRLELTAVSDPGSRATRINLLDAEGETLAALLVGKTQDFQAAGRSRYFVRDAGNDQAWLVEGVLPPVLGEMRNWLQQDLLAGVDAKALQRITVRQADGEVVTISRDGPDADFTLAELAAGERVDSQQALDAMVDTFRGLSLKDFAGQAAAEQAAPVATVEAVTFAGTRITADIRQGDPDYLVQLAAVREPGEERPADKGERSSDGADLARLLEKRWQERWFVVSQYSLDALLVERGDLLAGQTGSPDNG